MGTGEITTMRIREIAKSIVKEKELTESSIAKAIEKALAEDRAARHWKDRMQKR